MIKTTEETSPSEAALRLKIVMYQGDTFTDSLTKGFIDLRQFLELLQNSDDPSCRHIGNVTLAKATDMLFMTLRMKAAITDPAKTWYEAHEKKQCNITEILEHIADYFSAEASLKKYLFHYSIFQQIPELIYTDQVLLSRILISWFDNIHHFSTSGDHTSMRVSTENNEYLCIKIIDNAGSLEREEIRQLFSENREGMRGRVKYGNGLFLSQKMVRSLGGKIEIVPTLSGLEFYLYIPYQKP